MAGKAHSFWAGLLQQYGSAWETYRQTGLVFPVSGGAKGYNETADILTETVDGVPLDELYEQIMTSIRMLNRMRNPLIERLTFPVAAPFEEVMQIIGDEFEEADEFAQPKGIRLGVPWNMGFSLKYMDLGIRYTFRFLGRARASQIRALNNSALEADQRLLFKTVLERVFRNLTDSVTLEASGRVANVYPFYNGDETTLPAVPPPWKSYTHTNTHTHFLVSGGATVDSGDLDEMELHIHHHGYTEGATLILLANREQVNTINTFRIADADRWDFIPKAGISMFGQLIGGQPTDESGLAAFPGFRGRYGNINVIEEDYIPAKYMVLLASGGVRGERNPIGIREHENAALRGLKLIPQFERYPLRESFYHHAIGSGVRHPGAGVVMQVKASGDYEIPALSLQGQGGR